jgi:hypothetical protein
MSNEIKIDTKKAQKIMHKIIVAEAANLKSKGKMDAEMVKSIQKIIEEGV